MLEDIKKIIAEHKPEPIGEQRNFSVLIPLIRVDGALHVLYEVRGAHISRNLGILPSRVVQWSREKALKRRRSGKPWKS